MNAVEIFVTKENINHINMLFFGFYVSNDYISDTIHIGDFIIDENDIFDLIFGPYVKEEDFNKVLLIMKRFALNEILKDEKEKIMVSNYSSNLTGKKITNGYKNAINFMEKNNIELENITEVGYTKRKIRDRR